MGKSIVRLLQEAEADLAPVSVRRGKYETVDGYVVDVGDDWVVIAATSQVVYRDGWEVVRVCDISGVRIASRKARRYSDRAIAGLGTPVSKPAGLHVVGKGRKSVLRDVLNSAPVVTVHSEKKHPATVWVGHVLGFRGKRFALQFIDANGVWETGDRRFTLSEITRVTIGGRYNDALERFGEPRPE